MTESKTITITQEELANPKDRLFLCVFHDLRTTRKGLCIQTLWENLNIIMHESDFNIGVSGGELDKEQIIALRDYLTDYLIYLENKA